MDVLVYESIDKIMLGILENALEDNDIFCRTTGGADVGLGGTQTVRIYVSKDDVPEAKKIIATITGEAS